MNDSYYWIALKGVNGVGNVLFRRLLEHFGSPESVLKAAGESLKGVKGMTPRLVQRYGERMVTAVTRALALPERELPRFPRTRRIEPTDGAKLRLKHLKSWREQKSGNLGLEPGVIAPNWLLEIIADVNPVQREDLDSVAGMREWQKTAFGTELLNLPSEES